MAISFVNKGAFNSGTGAISVALPASIVAGDLLLLFIHTSNQGGFFLDAGWTTVAVVSNVAAFAAASAGANELTIVYRIATGADSAASVSDSGDHQAGIMLAYRGQHANHPFEFASPATSSTTSESTSSGTTMTFPGITTGGAGRMVILAAGMSLDLASTTTASGYANANLTSLTERHDQTIASGTGGGVVIADGLTSAGGATGSTTATSSSCNKVYVTMALRPGAPALSSPTATSVGTTSATPQVVVTR